MFRKIPVALDGTPVAASLPLAATLARGRPTELILVQVCADHDVDPSAHVAARDYLAAFAAGLAADGLHAGTEVRRGDVAGQIVAAARQHGADVILLTTHGRYGLARAWYGSVTEDVVARSPVPVLVLRAAAIVPQRLQTLLVPLDETPGSAAALAIAREVALATAATIVLLRVIPPLPRWGDGWDVNPGWEATMRQGAESALAGVARDLVRHGIPAHGRASIGPVAATIAATASELGADLIVMGTRALVGPQRALFGSVADAVVRTAERPVLLVRQSEGTGAEEQAGSVADGGDGARQGTGPGER